MSSTNPSPQESSSDNDLNDLLALLGSESESPSSTIPSIEDSLVQQLDSFEEVNEQQKTTLPPCQVCGGPSSGFHFGAYTCEACKVFFRRSKEIHDKYQKCLEIGMSKSRTKIGRYSKERHEENKKQLASMKMKNSMISYLPIQSDVQDIAIICNQSFEDFAIKNWNLEIDNFNDLFQRATGVMKQNISTKDEYMDIYEVTGVEIDHRCNYSEFVEIAMSVSYTRAMKCLRRLPGLDKIPTEDFFRVMLNHKEELYILMAIVSAGRWSSKGVTFQLDSENSVNLSKEYMAKMADEEVANYQTELGIKLTDLNIKFEEAVYLAAINMYSPTKQNPRLRDYQYRFILAFTKYLEEIYGKDYHLRLQQLISLLANFKESREKGRKWLEKNENYLVKIYKTNLIRAFFAVPDIDEGVKLLEGLKL